MSETNKKTVSVVIPTFNRASLISETIAAILNQSQPADEVIVVDDGSTDNTQDTVARFGGTVRSIIVPNGGALKARNAGLRCAKGELVAFCDDDDLWDPNFISNMAAAWTASPFLAVYSNFTILRDGINSKSTKLDSAPLRFWASFDKSQTGVLAANRDLVETLVEFQPFFTSCMMAHRIRFSEAGGWDESVGTILGEDFATALRVGSTGSVGIVLKPLVQIRKHSANMSGNTEAMNLGDANVLQYFLNSRPFTDQVRRVVLSSIKKRREEALDSAFSRRDYSGVTDIASLIGGRLGTRKRVLKLAIARVLRVFQ